MISKKKLVCLASTTGGVAASVAASSSGSSGAAAAAPLHAILELEESLTLLPPRTRRRAAGGGRHHRHHHRDRRRRRTRRRTPHRIPNESSPEGHPRSLRAETQLPLPSGLLPRLPNSHHPPSAHADPDGLDPSSSSSGAPPFAPRIINGAPTPFARYPWAASLLLTESSEHICGGTLIAPDVVLTAGHCSGFFDSIQVGLHDRSSQPARTYDHLIVEEHVAHPGYGNVIMNDFGLAKLYGSSSVRPVRINNRRNVPDDNAPLTVMGWGVTSEGVSSTASDVLRSVEVTGLSNEACEQSSGEFEGEDVSYAGYIMDNMLCARGTDSDACQGDSGGPLVQTTVFPGHNGVEPTEVDVQVGVVSWGLGCALDAFPGVYARVSAEYDWIRSQVCTLSADPPDYLGCRSDAASPSFIPLRMNLSEVTIAIELDGRPEDTSWVFEEDPGVAAKTASAGRTARIEGTSQVPFDTYDAAGTVATQFVEVAPDEQYRLTLLDRGGDGLVTPGRIGRQSRFRVCYGAVPGPECIAASRDSDLVVCSGDGNFQLARSITCYVNMIETPAPTPKPVKPPTYAPFEVPLLYDFMDDDRFRPTPKPTRVPSTSPVAEPTGMPTTTAPTTGSPTIDGTQSPTKLAPTAFLSGTSLGFGALANKATEAPPPSLPPEGEGEVLAVNEEPPVGIAESNNAPMSTPVNNGKDEGASSSSCALSYGNMASVMAVISTIFIMG